MLEETSTSASAAAMASVVDLFWSKTAGNSSVDVSTPSNAPEIHFSSGNPRIEETRGLMHLYRDAAAPSSFSLPDDRKPLICVLGVPNHMTYSDFCKFCGSFIQHMLEMRIVRTEGLEDHYSILIRLDDQNSADSFYNHFKGKCFSSLEEETCHVFFTADIQYTGSIEHSQPSTGNSGEQPSCPVCLGCGRYKDGHAVSHWKETQHCYSLELETQRVWDYVGDNYVHRLIQSKTDGKLVELNSHCKHKDDGCDDCIGYCDTVPDSEVESIVNEYNELLTSQLENQKNYFESLLQEVEEDTERESSAAVEKTLSQNPKLLKLQAKLDKLSEEKKFFDDINDNLLRNQSIWDSKIDNIEEREKKLLKLKDETIEELEEQLRTLMESLETAKEAEQKSTEQHPTTSTELKDEILPGTIDSSTKGAARGKGKG